MTAQRNGSDIDPAVAVRSSATAEDLPDASFAGQHETFLNIRGERPCSTPACAASPRLFTDRAISYRETKGFDHLAVALSVGVQQMVRSDLAGSGVMFTIDTESGFPGVATISAAWGLGETIVQGAVNPDRYVVFKPLLDTPGARPIIEKALGDKAIRMIYAEEGRQTDPDRALHPGRARSLRAETTRRSSNWAAGPLRWSGTTAGRWTSNGPRTAQRPALSGPGAPRNHPWRRGTGQLPPLRLKDRCQPLLSGVAIGSAIASGKVCVIRRAPTSPIFRTARSSSPAIPIPTGCRS
jgi:pyruvate, water dikinase